MHAGWARGWPRTRARVIDRRRARIGFGAALIAGAIALVVAMISGLAHAYPIVGVSWAAAAGAVVLAWATQGHGPDRDRLAVAGLVVPIVGIALFGPISVHVAIGAMAGAAAADVDVWVKASLVITGVAHAVFASLAATRAARLAGGWPAMTPGRILGITIAVSCVPFALAFGLPPLLVAVTGAPFLPVLEAMAGVAAREREELRGASGALPLAIARGG
jgi:hypothetical protein